MPEFPMGEVTFAHLALQPPQTSRVARLPLQVASGN